MTRQVLIVKTSSLGDVVHALPAAADAVAQGIAVDWVVEEAFADIPRLLPGVRRVIPVAWRRWRRQLSASRTQMAEFYQQLRQQRYDLIVDSQGLLKSAAISMLACGPVAGFSFTSAREPWSAFAYQRRYQVARQQHAIDRQRQLFAAALGYVLPPQYSQIGAVPGAPAISTASASAMGTDTAADNTSANTIDNTTEAPQIIFLHGTTWQSKHWPESMWVALAGLIQQDGYSVALTWGDDAEQQRANRIAAATGVRVLERMPLNNLVKTLQRARLVIGVDSGLVHLSAGLGIPTLGLYGPTDAHLTGARGSRALSLQAQLPCSPCVRPLCTEYRGEPLRWQQQVVQPPCFATLPPELVWQRGQRVMALPPAQQAGAPSNNSEDVD